MKPTVLLILDGCGIREESDGNAFKNANKPCFDYLWNNYPHSFLEASGPAVGLPEGQMGTSEVGHMNIGAGRVTLQPLQAIYNSILDESIFKNKELLEVINHVKKNNSNLHFIGLLSDGGVHSHVDHLFALIDLCKKEDLQNVYFDIFTDGRDVYEKSALKYLDMLNEKIKEVGFGHISTISGRYYGMDRDNNFDRLKKSYDAICYSEGEKNSSYEEYINKSYEKGITDEFLEPVIIDSVPINDNDGVITFNFRKDRLRELFTLLTNYECYEKECLEKNLNIKKYNNLKVVTMFPVVETVKCPHVFNDVNMENILASYLNNCGKKQLRISETEKFPHVTFFFDGGKELDYELMKKVLIPSPKVATYDMQPEMSVYKVTDAFLEEIENFDVVMMNFANGDMVGHTGNYDAAKKAVEDMDECIKKVYDKVMELDGTLMVIADHGNCDIMWDKDHKPVTSHTTSKVPCIITKKGIELTDGKLADVAPTLLTLMNIEVPKEMTGNILIK